MKVSVIAAVYKDVQALDLIVQSLKHQTYKNFELIVAEDGKSDAMKQYVASIGNLDVIHTTQEDLGVRKARSQNNAIVAATGEYLIFIDGDCFLNTHFVESHTLLAEAGSVLSGRRLNLNADLTQKLRSHALTPEIFEKKFWWYSLPLVNDREARFEQGIFLDPKGWIYQKFINGKARTTNILGCNFSCFKKDIVAINGFDEGYGESAVSDDMDLDWRFRAYGLQLKSCKNAAVMYHLHHKAHDRGDATAEVEKMRSREKEGLYVCEKGLNTH